MSHCFSKLKRIPSGPVQQLNNNHTTFHPHLLLSLCSHTVDFYGMGLIPIGCNGAGFSDALCACEQKAGWLAPRRFPLTVVSTEWVNSLSHLPSPPGLLAAFRQNTSVATSEHVLKHVRACVTTAVMCWYSMDFMSKLWHTYARVLPWCTVCNRKTRQFLQCISYPYNGHMQHSKASYLGARGLHKTYSTLPQQPLVKGFTPPRNLPVTCRTKCWFTAGSKVNTRPWPCPENGHTHTHTCLFYLSEDI